MRKRLPRVVILRAEVGGECLWTERGSCIEYRELGLPQPLVARLDEWNEHHWRAYERYIAPMLAEGQPHGRRDFDEEWFVAEAGELAEALRRELGPSVELRSVYET